MRDLSYHDAMPNIQTLHRRILDQLGGFAELAADASTLELGHDSTSSWNIAQHLVHLALVDVSILKRLEPGAENAESATGGPTLIGRCMLALGYIPRGRGKAPAISNPRQPNIADIAPQMTETRQRFVELEPDLPRLGSGPALAKHFAFGHLNGTQWLRFVEIHHHHHAKIIREIQRAV